MLRSFHKNLVAFRLNKKHASKQVEQIEVMEFASDDFCLTTYLWTFRLKELPQLTRFEQDLGQNFLQVQFGIKKSIITFSYDHEITQTLTS